MVANKHCPNELYIGFDIIEHDNIVSIASCRLFERAALSVHLPPRWFPNKGE